MDKVVLATGFLVQAHCKDLEVVQVARSGHRTSSEDLQSALQRATEPQNADITCDSLRGVTCLHTSTLPVTPKGMQWSTKEENYVEDEKKSICTFNNLSFV